MAAEIGESIRVALLALSAVTDLVGTGDAARIRPWYAQQDPIPANGSIITETQGVRDPLNDLGGLGGRDHHDVNILCRAPTKEACRALARAVRFNGTDPGTGLHGITTTPIDVEIDCTLETETGPFPILRQDGSTKVWWEVELRFDVEQAEVA